MARRRKIRSSRLKPVIIVDTTYTDEPTLVQGAVNPADISLVLPAKTKHWEPCVRLKMKDGDRIVCVGTAVDFMGRTFPHAKKKMRQ
jgi:hypothetical protein